MCVRVEVYVCLFGREKKSIANGSLHAYKEQKRLFTWRPIHVCGVSFYLSV